MASRFFLKLIITSSQPSYPTKKAANNLVAWEKKVAQLCRHGIPLKEVCCLLSKREHLGHREKLKIFGCFQLSLSLRRVLSTRGDDFCVSDKWLWKLIARYHHHHLWVGLGHSSRLNWIAQKNINVIVYAIIVGKAIVHHFSNKKKWKWIENGNEFHARFVRLSHHRTENMVLKLSSEKTYAPLRPHFVRILWELSRAIRRRRRLSSVIGWQCSTFFIRRESITKSAWLLAAGFVAKKEKYKLWVLEEIERNGKFPFCTTKTTTTTRARYLFETWNIPFHFIILDRSAEWHNHLNPTSTLMLRKFTISWIIRTANLIDLFGQRVEIKFAKKVNFRGHWTNFFSFCPICMRVWT